MDIPLKLPFENERYQALLKLAAERYGPISEAEKDVLRRSAATELFGYSTAGEPPEVHAQFLRWLATDKDAATHIDPLGIRVAHATISGSLDLESCKIPFPPRFEGCTFKSMLILRHAELPNLYLFTCTAEAGIGADGLISIGDVFLRPVDSSGEIRLLGAQIGGSLECDGATLKAAGSALNANRARITGSVFLRNGFSSAGEVNLLGAQIGGNLDCEGATLAGKAKALHAEEARITGSVFLRNGFSSAGEVNLLDAQIGGTIDCSGAALKATESALDAGRARISGDVFLNNGFSSAGGIHLLEAQIGGSLNCSSATLKATGTALSAHGAKIAGSVYLVDGFSSAGRVGLSGAQIGGNLECDGATLTAVESALDADGARITGNVFLRNGFSSTGRISFPRADITGDLDCDQATLTAKGTALDAGKARINGHVFFRRGFSAGLITLQSAEIGGQLSCAGATLTAAGDALNAVSAKIKDRVLLRYGFTSAGTVSVAGAEIGGDLDCTSSSIARLTCNSLRLTGDLYWLGIGKPAVSNPNGLGAASGTFARLDLTGANVATLYDDPTSWPRSGRLILQNFVYQYLVPCEPPDPRLQDPQLAAILFPDGWHRKALKLSARDRIDWLRRQPEDDLTNAQPWVQLAKVLKDAGDENGAKEVLYEYNRVLARPENVLRRAATWPVDLLQKQPLWVAVPIAALTGLSSLVFWRAHRMRAMVPTDKDARSPFVTKQPLPDGYPPFNPIVYSLENVLPVIKLGQDSAWAPYAQALPATWLPERPAWLRNFANRWRFTRWLFRLSYSRLALLRWTLILLGWVLAGILTYAIGQRFEH